VKLDNYLFCVHITYKGAKLGIGELALRLNERLDFELKEVIGKNRLARATF